MTTIQNLKGIILGLLIVVGISYAQAAWQGPTATPPNGNTDAPINVSATGQTKAGGLVLNTSGAGNGLIVSLGRVGIGVATPSVTLDVNGSFSANSTVKLGGFVSCGSLSTDASGNLVCGAGQSPSPPGPVFLVNDVHTTDDCVNAGGNVSSIGGGESVCKFSGSSCLSGWTKYQNWTTTQSSTCTSEQKGCGVSTCTTSQHLFSNNGNREGCYYYPSYIYGHNYCSRSTATCAATVVEIGCY